MKIKLIYKIIFLGIAVFLYFTIFPVIKDNLHKDYLRVIERMSYQGIVDTVYNDYNDHAQFTVRLKNGRKIWLDNGNYRNRYIIGDSIVKKENYKYVEVYRGNMIYKYNVCY